ncbi:MULTISPECIES: N-acetyltransferase [Butyricimonas]|uniref:N-acetyltransferase n=1 Tax=Butyricimonas TaxID=574697 RepID=UPI000B3800A0|nr:MULTISPECIES: N-acetyltransferase [Butyricimonas]OUN67118.1 N-acetyltransferase [Butyricimonas sp. An62]
MIRHFQQQDEAAVIQIWLEASAIAHSFIPRSYWENKVLDMRNAYLPQSQTHVHEDEHTNEITGFISLIGNYIAALFVSPNRQGQGIGQALMAYIKQQHPELELNVYAENTQALTFYKHQGFTITREQTDEQTGRQEFTMKYQRDT